MYETQQLTLQEEFQLPRIRYKSAARTRSNAISLRLAAHPALSAGILGCATVVTGRLMLAMPEVA